MISEQLYLAKDEFKRADHLMFVSLKYTRTVDVIKSLIERLINTYDNGINALLEHKEVKDIPKIQRLKADMLLRTYPDDEHLHNYMKLYFLLRDINKAKYDRTLEFRRHVHMTAYLNEHEIEVSIDIVEDYFNRTKEFIEYVESLIKGKDD